MRCPIMCEEKNPAAQPSADQAFSAPRPRWDGWKAVLFTLALLAAVTVQTVQVSLLALALALVLSLGRRPIALLGERFCLPVVGFLAFTAATLFAAIHAVDGSPAVTEFTKYLAAFALGLALLTRLEGRHVPALLWGLAAVSAVISILCIDMDCAAVLFTPFREAMYSLGSTYEGIINIEASRINGIYNNANVSAAILGLGALVSLHLASETDALWKKLLACVLLGVNALGFFLSLSRGAILFFALALVVYLIAVGKGRRLSLFFLMFISAVVTVACSMAAIPGLMEDTLLPDLLAPACGLVIFLLDWLLGGRLARALEGKGKIIALLAAVLAAACVAYAVAGVTINVPYTFDATGYLGRTLDLEPGEYTLFGDWDGEVTAVVLVQNQLDRYYHNGTILYQGSLEDAAFTVPAEGRVTIQLQGQEGQTIRSLRASDGSEVHLGYPLLPSFVANRLQDSLRDSNSTFMRIQYFQDTWTLFLQSPLVGHGLGSTETWFTSVQDFYYESKYTHNHVLQVMSDMGLLGTIPFLALLLGSVLLLLRGARKEKDPLAAMLLACWVLMNGHSLMELNFSFRPYLCVAMVFLLLPVVLYARPLAVKGGKTAKAAGAVLLCLLVVSLGASLAALEGRRTAVRRLADRPTDNVEAYLDYCQDMLALDKLNPEQVKLNYVANAVRQGGESPYYDQMLAYVQDLRGNGTYFSCTGVSEYYYLYLGQIDQVFETSREAIAQKASDQNAWDIQFAFYREEVLPVLTAENAGDFVDGVLATKAYLESYNQTHTGQITVSEEDGAFRAAVEELAGAGLSGEDTLARLQALFSTETAS